MLIYQYRWIYLVCLLCAGPITMAQAQSPSQMPSVSHYHDNINEIETQEGPYSHRLSEQLMPLSEILQQQNKHEEAIERLKRVLHLQRVNEGLYSPSQIKVINQMITSHRALKQWKKVNDSIAYQYWLHSMNYDQDDKEMINITLKVANWSLKSYSLKLNDVPQSDLINAHRSYQRLIKLLSQQHGETSLKVLDALNGQLITNYLISTSFNPNVSQSDDLTFNDAATIKSLQVRSFSRGIDTINQELRILKAQPIINHIRVVQSMLKLADWHLMYGRPQSATAQYQLSYQYVQEHDSDNQFYVNLFSKPVALPRIPHLNLNSTEKLTQQDIELKKKYVLASFNVTRRGQVKKIKVVAADDQVKSATQNKIVRRLRYATFRPQLSLGQPVLTKQAQLHVYVD